MNFSSVNAVVFVLGRITPSGVNPLGTIFLLPKPGLFATAAHIAGNEDQNLVITIKRLSSIQDYQDTSDASCQTLPVKFAALDAFHDLCILKAEGNGSASNFRISGTDAAQVGDNVAVFGFPHCDHGRVVLTQQNTEIGARVLIKAGGVKAKNVVLNIQSRPGQSGSPIFSFRDGSLVAVLIGSYIPQGGGSISLGGIDPSTLHQTTHAVSAEYLIPMLASL
jgi:hypothetical protein